MKYQAILFDMDGTIVDSEPLHQQAFISTFKDYGITLTDNDFKTYILGKTGADSLRDYLSHIGSQIDAAEFSTKKAATYIALATGNLESYDGVIEMIRELANQVPLALVTNSRRPEADLVLSSFDIDDCFDIIVTADDVNEGKPNPEGYLRAVSLLTKDPGDCVVIEDSPVGVTAANEAGIHCIAVTNTHTEVELSHADLVVEQLSDRLF